MRRYLVFVGILLLGHGRIMIEGLVSYPSRTTITTGVSDDIHRIEIDDTKNSLGQMLIVGPSTFLSIEKNSTRDYSTLVRGIEAVALLKETTKNKKSSGYGSLLVVACSRRNLRSPGNAPIGSITLVQKIASKNAKHDAIAKALVPSKNLQGPTILIREVNGRDVKVIDVDKDGHLDIIASVSGISEGGKLAGFLLYLQNDGKNNFAKIQFVSESLNGKAVIGVGDCDQNGFVDIAVLGIDSKQLSVFYQIENTKFIEKLIDSNTSTNFAIAVGYFNDDNGSDIFTIGRAGITGYLAAVNAGNVYSRYRGFKKNEMITFDTKTFNKLSNDYRAYQIKLRDADNDGLLDILAVYGEQNGLKWMKQLPNNRMDGGPVDLVTIDKPDSFDVHDINNDGIPDIVIHSSTSIYLYPGKE